MNIVCVVDLTAICFDDIIVKVVTVVEIGSCAADVGVVMGVADAKFEVMLSGDGY